MVEEKLFPLLREFAAEPPRPGAIRDELMVKVQALDEAGPEVVREFVAERAQWARGKLDRYRRLRERLLDGRTEEAYLRDAERVGPYLTLLRGISFEEENLRWCEHVLNVLDERTGATDRA